MPSSSESPYNDQESRERIMQSVYDHLMRSVVVSYSANMHEMIKTGGISASELQTPSSRQEIFPTLYEGKSSEEIQAELDLYATEIPSRQRKRKLRHLHSDPSTISAKGGDDSDDEHKDEDKEDDDDDDDDDDDEDFKDENEEEEAKVAKVVKVSEAPASTAASSQADQQSSSVDIWGRIPPKEPKLPVECTLCGRHLSTSRFASHLEKCMGLSTRPLPGVVNRNASASSILK